MSFLFEVILWVICGSFVYNHFADNYLFLNVFMEYDEAMVGDWFILGCFLLFWIIIPIFWFLTKLGQFVSWAFNRMIDFFNNTT